MTNPLHSRDASTSSGANHAGVEKGRDFFQGAIGDVLEFSRVEAGEIEPEPAPFSLRPTITEGMRAFGALAQRKGLELSLDVHPKVPDAVVGDHRRLRQILANLIGNAIRFTERGDVVVSVEAEATTEDFVHVRFSVSDTGIGIPAEKQKQLFELAGRVEGGATRNKRSTGLGLATCSRLVRLLGGELRLSSTVGSGTTFYFAAKLGLGGRDAETSASALPERFKGARVLVVDDNARSRRILETMLHGEGLSPVLAAHVEDALTVLRERGAAFDLVLADGALPAAFDLLSRMREDARLATIPVVTLVWVARANAEEEYRRAGVKAQLVKPVLATELRETVATMIEGLGRRTAIKDEAHALPPAAPRVLLAEDNPVNRLVALRMLERLGYDVTTVEDGREVLAALDAERFDLVLMDVQMPEMDGLEATRVIRGRERERGSTHIPIVALTAHAMTGDRERCLEAGMDAYLSKPVDSRRLRAVLAEVTETTAGRQRKSSSLDWEALSARVDGDRDLIVELVKVFLEDEPKTRRDIRESLDRGDAPAVERSAHRLKGALLSLGANAASTEARRLEEMGRCAGLNQAEEAWRDLTRELERLKPELTSIAERGVPT